MGIQYSKLTVEGDKKTRWICGCFETTDGYFKFCEKHDKAMSKAIKLQIDELDMTLVVAADTTDTTIRNEKENN